jgi:DNA-directed RNA polymerase specialized sigma24 family protein
MRSVGTLEVANIATPAERALAMYPRLLLRAEELSGDWSRAQDLVQDTFEACVRKPPEARTDIALLHWMRQVMANLNAKAFHREARLS